MSSYQYHGCRGLATGGYRTSDCNLASSLHYYLMPFQVCATYQRHELWPHVATCICAQTAGASEILPQAPNPKPQSCFNPIQAAKITPTPFPEWETFLETVNYVRIPVLVGGDFLKFIIRFTTVRFHCNMGPYINFLPILEKPFWPKSRVETVQESLVCFSSSFKKYILHTPDFCLCARRYSLFHVSKRI